MPTFIALAKFTEQGLRNIKGTVDRADAARKAAEAFGATIKDIYWVQGQYDIVILLEAKDDTSANAFSLATAAQGNVQFQTLRAITRDEMKQVLAKLP
ncbi:GYD domain-containing protein [Ramlibacter solisilvae]|uniref:GYD family protein n=1 Tax=Ramlibacter tataouinensis TaxID=94132 RepID=A0A127JP83_9BURK|nr:GYD domain-containing protein [Ramlibacter tataouinensis]AMO21844.1 GYD family protein [Ramlibacter tataouinensis]